MIHIRFDYLSYILVLQTCLIVLLQIIKIHGKEDVFFSTKLAYSSDLKVFIRV